MRGKIEVRDVTAENQSAVAALELDPEQAELLDDNASSLDEASDDPDARPRAIYAGDKLVGFLMYDAGGARDKPRKAVIYRFMIDRHHQGGGYGRAALEATIGEIRAIVPKVASVSISYVPENTVAKAFYARFGFKETELDEDDEMVAVLAL